MKRLVAIVAMCVLVVGMFGCTRTQKGTTIGAGAGAILGGAIGKIAGDNTAVGAILGAAVGGAAGAYIGKRMDAQAAEIQRDLEGARVERVGEGIKVTFDSGILFAVNKSDLQSEARANLDKLAVILQKYEDTDVLIEGHTDDTGSESHNMVLSKDRARSVANYLAQLGVAAGRFTQMGYGEGQPIVSNATAEGRQQNRRVELAIMANDKLKREAQRQAG